jgi:hypothetical protein
VGLVVAVFVLALLFAGSSPENGRVAQDNLTPPDSFRHAVGAGRFGSSLIACLWCFDGFADANFLLEELR